jgi:sulfur transfer protein SufE
LVRGLINIIHYYYERRVIRKEIEEIKKDIHFLTYRTELDDPTRAQLLYSMFKRLKELEARIL